MTKEKPKTAHRNRRESVMLILTAVAVIIAFTGMNYQNVASWFSSTLFPKSDYMIESSVNPTVLPFDYRDSLTVSPSYFIVTSVNLKQDTPYQGEAMQISISFENKGKKTVERPRVLVYFVDFLYRIWGVWNKTDANDVLAKGCSLEYHFPPLDQKISGTWVVFVMLYDDAEGVLASYELKTFRVMDTQTPWYEVYSGVLALIAVVIFTIGVAVVKNWQDRRKPKPGG
jgi:hypothetical protein